MSLDWDVSRVVNKDVVCWRVAEADDPMEGISKGEEVLTGITKTMIFATMAVGMGEIANANAREFYKRLRVYENLNGAFRTIMIDGARRDLFVTYEAVLAHIGLTTNVSKEPLAKWSKRIIESALRDAERRIDMETVEREAAVVAENPQSA